MTRTSLLHKALFLCGISALAALLGGCATGKIKNLTIQVSDAEGYERLSVPQHSGDLACASAVSDKKLYFLKGGGYFPEYCGETAWQQENRLFPS